MAQALGEALPDGWQGAFFAALGRGDTIAEASEACQVSVGHLYRIRNADNDFRSSWDEAKRLRSERRRDWVLDRIHEIAEDDNHKASIAALFKLFDALPENRVKELAITGDPDRPIIVTHQRGLTIADLIADPRAARLVEQARRQLPAAGEVLAEPPRSLDPASDLPPGPVA